MPTTQTVFRELLHDPAYKAWLKRQPTLPHTQGHRGQVWVVHYLREGKWESRSFHEYGSAYDWAVKVIKKVDDLAIACTAHEFKPPIIKVGMTTKWITQVDPKTQRKERVKVKVPVRKFWSQLPGKMPEGHHWCGYCRRPTVFGYFTKHHALKFCVPYERRCRICGVRLRFLGHWSH